MPRENAFQTKLEAELSLIYPDAIILKNDPNIVQGIPDLIIIHHGKWAFLECKRREDAPWQVNQDYYIGYARQFAFGEFIYPENKIQVLGELYEYFRNS